MNKNLRHQGKQYQDSNTNNVAAAYTWQMDTYGMELLSTNHAMYGTISGLLLN